MKLLTMIIAGSAGILLLSTMICGLWIRSQKGGVDPSSITFHSTIAIVSVLFGLLTAVLLMVQVARHGL